MRAGLEPLSPAFGRLAPPPRLCQAWSVLDPASLASVCVGPATLVGAALLGSLALASTAAADENNAAVAACEGKAESDACTFKAANGKETSGKCTTDECCELDYSKGSPPETKCGPCLACKAGPPVPTPDGPPVADGGEAAADGAKPDGEAPRTSSDPPASGGNEKRGCSVGGDAPGWGALLLLGLVVARRRWR